MELVVSRRRPRRLARLGPGHWFIDFGRAVFGTIELTAAAPADRHEVRVHLGEKLAGPMRIDRSPPGAVRYRGLSLVLNRQTTTLRVLIPPDERNTGPRAIPMPRTVGEVMPFRYCELEEFPGTLDPEAVGQLFVHAPFDDSAAFFESSDPVLNDVWDLCRHTIKATTFCGLYVDGDRERIPYEGDAYINQLSHYALDADYRMARATLHHLIDHATWPADWQLHMPLIAWYDFLYSGNDDAIRRHYAALKAKTLAALAGEDGLISTRTGLVTPDLRRALGLDDFFKDQDLRELVDWPPPGWFGPDTPGETDGYVFTPVNTVLNALHHRSLVLMERIAGALGKEADRGFFAARAQAVARAVNTRLFDPGRGVYVDGDGTDHASQHANFFPLMTDIVPEKRIQSVVEFVKSRDMACSVYGAQHLLDGLYRVGEAEHGFALLTATHDRSWHHMSRGIGSTMTLEAWGTRYKPNLDWNHAWGAAPANIIVRRLLGVRPIAPGFARAIIAPQAGPLRWVRARVPTPLGPIELELWNEPGRPPELSVAAPNGVETKVVPPRHC